MSLDVQLWEALLGIQALTAAYISKICMLLDKFRCERALVIRNELEYRILSAPEAVHRLWSERSTLDRSCYAVFDKIRNLSRQLAHVIKPLVAIALNAAAPSNYKFRNLVEPYATISEAKGWVKHVKRLSDNECPVGTVTDKKGRVYSTMSQWVNPLNTMVGLIKTIDFLRAQSVEPAPATLQ